MASCPSRLLNAPRSAMHKSAEVLCFHEVHEVDFDNVALYSYRDHAALERRVAPLTLLLSVMLTVLGLGFMYKLRQQWIRESDY